MLRYEAQRPVRTGFNRGLMIGTLAGIYFAVFLQMAQDANWFDLFY